jgi:bacterioferritin (cytochrome b1)
MNKAMMHAILKKKSENGLDALTDGLIANMKFNDSSVLYPTGEVSKDSGVNPEWFYQVYKGSVNFSEMNAIFQYVSQDVMYDTAAELFLGIGMVEMKHFDKLGDLITGLGGNIDFEYNSSAVNYGSNPADAVRANIEGEQATINEYNRIVDLINNVPKNKTTEYCLQLLAKLIADETYHLKLLNDWLESNGHIIRLKTPPVNS